MFACLHKGHLGVPVSEQWVIIAVILIWLALEEPGAAAVGVVGGRYFRCWRGVWLVGWFVLGVVVLGRFGIGAALAGRCRTGHKHLFFGGVPRVGQTTVGADPCDCDPARRREGSSRDAGMGAFHVVMPNGGGARDAVD